MDIQESEKIIREICWLGQVLCLLSGELVPSRVRRHHSHCWSYPLGFESKGLRAVSDRMLREAKTDIKRWVTLSSSLKSMRTDNS